LENTTPIAVDPKDGRILLNAGWSLGYYDPKTLEIETIYTENIPDHGIKFCPIICHESLVWPFSPSWSGVGKSYFASTSKAALAVVLFEGCHQWVSSILKKICSSFVEVLCYFGLGTLAYFSKRLCHVILTFLELIALKIFNLCLHR
jgi:hypothetical protein